MPNAFDPYREALVIENKTVWPEEYDAWDADIKQLIERQAHAAPQDALELDYVRQHTGFAREIWLCPDEIDRFSQRL